MAKRYGTSRGVAIADAVIERLADRAERGLDHARLRPRGRPLLGKGPSRTAQVRLPPDLSDALARRAAHDQAVP